MTIPKVRKNGATVGVIAGNYGKTLDAVQGDFVKALFLDVALEPGSEWQIPTDKEATLFIYIVEGARGIAAGLPGN